jgi:hypothetical protein
VAGAARNAGRQAARLGLLAALAACAVIEQPPGGPPDFEPPVILSVTPDSGAVVPELDDALKIQFDEVISEASGGGLDELIRLSPRAEEVSVDWKRSAIEVAPKDGWLPGTVYHVVLEPGIADLRNNPTTEGRTVIFSTGPPIPTTVLWGTVLDWQNARAARFALIEAVLLPDSLVYVTTADSVGGYRLVSVPPGTYHVSASLDENTNRRRDTRESFDSVTVAIDSVVSHTFWAFSHDTAGPQLRRVNRTDSVTVQVRFSLMLDTVPPTAEMVSVWALPDTTPVAVAAVWERAVYDSLAAEEAAARALADSLAADSAAALDTLALADSAVGDTVAVPQAARARPPPGADPAVRPGRGPQVPEHVTEFLARRPPLSDIWFIRLVEPLTPGGRYLIEARARSIGGSLGESRTVLAVSAPRDST